VSGRLSEVTEVHTRILRLALAVEESRAYWANIDPSVPAAQRAVQAFEERWFGAKTLERVRTLMSYLASRYDPYPQALDVLRRWRHMDPTTRQALCHFHLQISDPLYRRFTGEFLVERREGPVQTVDREVVLKWVERQEPSRWAAATLLQFASKLMSAAGEAGLLSNSKADVRTLAVPQVTDAALVYLLRLLETLDFDGELLSNAYLASVGLTGAYLDQRLRQLPGLTFQRMGRLSEMHWQNPGLQAWAEASL
jgi:hypothetical protein